jgi:hypothetical protein
MCTLVTSKGTDIDENIANQNHATRTRTPKPGYLNLSIDQLRPRGLHIVTTDFYQTWMRAKLIW